jgi:hypothetical protein
MNIPKELSPVDGRIHQLNQQLIQAVLQTTTGAQFLAHFGAPLFNGSEVVWRYTSSSQWSPTVVVRDMAAGKLLVVAAGMQGYANVPFILEGWDTNSAIVDRLQRPYQLVAQYLQNSLAVVTPVGGWREITLVGHSYGGAVITNLAAQMQPIPADRWFKIYSYGAPKSDVEGGRLSHVESRLRRMFLPNDPVPNLPPNLSDLGSLWAVVRNTQADLWARWRHQTDGYAIQPDGSVICQRNPTINSVYTFTQSLIAWLSGITAFGADAHSATAYFLACSQMPFAVEGSVGPENFNTPVRRSTLTRQQMGVARDEAIITLEANASGNPIEAARQVVANTALIPGLRFHAGIANGRIAIFYNGLPVCYPRTKRRRRALTRYLNRVILPTL